MVNSQWNARQIMQCIGEATQQGIVEVKTELAKAFPVFSRDPHTGKFLELFFVFN
jgi:hypothetical protein